MPRGARKRGGALGCVMGQVHDLPVFGGQKEREAERVAFFERAWEQKRAREAAEAERAKKLEKKAQKKEASPSAKEAIAKKQPKKGVVAQSDEESGDESGEESGGESGGR